MLLLILYCTVFSLISHDSHLICQALELLAVMRSSGVSPDASSYSAVISSCHWRDALALLHDMELAKASRET